MKEKKEPKQVGSCTSGIVKQGFSLFLNLLLKPCAEDSLLPLLAKFEFFSLQIGWCVFLPWHVGFPCLAGFCRDVDGRDLAPVYFGGVYLPVLLPPEQRPSRCPVLLAYSHAGLPASEHNGQRPPVQHTVSVLHAITLCVLCCSPPSFPLCVCARVEFSDLCICVFFFSPSTFPLWTQTQLITL